MFKVHSFTVLPALPEQIKELDTIARNMFWSWNPDFVKLFKRIDKNLWHECGHNPVKLLGSVSQERLDALAENHGFVAELKRASDRLKSYLKAPAWFESVCSKTDRPVIAYFSAEFGVHESLPIYAGGLGILAGDHLKSASDLGVPMVGIGLLYQKGFFRQYLNVDGWQQEVYAENDFYNMPVELVRNDRGEPVTVSVEYPGRNVHAQVWLCPVGRVALYFLDTNIPANDPVDRMITTTVYGGDSEMRIRQEVMLGIGGMRALDALGIRPTICHMNEGHTAFLTLERARRLIQENGFSFDEAVEATRPGNAFTIHTPVRAGIDEFSVELMRKYFGAYVGTLGISVERLLGLGRILQDDEGESFKMPILAMRMAGFVNGVSELHGKVSRELWASLWRAVPVDEVPIGHVTNGVHLESWLSDEIMSLYDRYLGPHWIDDAADTSLWENIDQIPEEELWHCHQRCKERLVAFVRSQLKAQIQRRGSYHSELNRAEEVLDPEALTIGFARRFAGYKRANLLFKDPERLARLLSESKRPVQIIFAGKAHPRDNEGKEIIRQLIHFTTQYNVTRRVVFIEDYDINVAKMLVQGVDVWLNNPRRPWEASGTSGMKAAVNGALNMSTLDGWWCEGFRPDGGWAIGAGETYEDLGYQDMIESQAIYNIFENEVIPLFYTRSTDNLPRAWLQRMRESIKWIAPRFNTRRMVAEYTRQVYLPAQAKWSRLAANDMAEAKSLAAWKSNLRAAWSDVVIKDVKVEMAGCRKAAHIDGDSAQLKVGSKLRLSALIKLGKVKPDEISAEIYHGPVDSRGIIRDGAVVRMEHKGPTGLDNEHWFTGLTPFAVSGRQGVAIRVVPSNPDLINPYDLGLVLWESHP